MIFSDDCMSDVCLTFVAYIGRNSRTESPRKTKIGTEVAHVTRYSDTTFKVKGHQAALVGCTGRPTWTYSNGDLSVCVHDVYSVTYHLHPWAGHIVAAAGLQLVTMFIRHYILDSLVCYYVTLIRCYRRRDDVVHRRGYCDHFVTMSVCVCVGGYVRTIKRKPLIGIT